MNHSNTSVDSLNRRVRCTDCGTTLYPGADTCSECGSSDINLDWNSLQSAYEKHDIAEAYFKGRVEQIGLEIEHWGIDKRHEDDHLIFDNKMDLRLWEPLDGQSATPEWPHAGSTQETIIESFDIGVETLERRWQLRGVADVKSKASESWLGKFNLRHLAHYAEWADRYGADSQSASSSPESDDSADEDVPTFVYMTMVDTDAESVGEADFFTPITSDWDWELLVDHYDSDSYTDLSYGELKDTARECDIVSRTFRAPDGNLVVTISDDYRYNWDYFVEDVL